MPPPWSLPGTDEPVLFRLPARRLDATVELAWLANATAVLICDMWDDHWCKRAAARSAELAPRISEFARFARAAGATIVHAPANTMDYYASWPQRQRAVDAKAAATDVVLRWRKVDSPREPALPIDYEDGGCDDDVVTGQSSFKPHRQHPGIAIDDNDLVSDQGTEIYGYFASHGITNLIMTGVHLNICVLSRPFGIRQMVSQGMNVVLARDLTDSLYNPARAPFVSHEQGTELVVRHVEQFWCPTIASSDLIGPEARSSGH